jgi:hypothetical protein
MTVGATFLSQSLPSLDLQLGSALPKVDRVSLHAAPISD